jgi:hypothetical protein
LSVLFIGTGILLYTYFFPIPPELWPMTLASIYTTLSSPWIWGSLFGAAAIVIFFLVLKIGEIMSQNKNIVLVMGKPNTGKSMSLRNLNQEKMVYLNTDLKEKYSLKITRSDLPLEKDPLHIGYLKLDKIIK